MSRRQPSVLLLRAKKYSVLEFGEELCLPGLSMRQEGFYGESLEVLVVREDGEGARQRVQVDPPFPKGDNDH